MSALIKIILFGDKSDTLITLPLCRSLERYGGVLYFGDGCLAEYSCSSPKFAVFETDTLCGCDTENTIIIFKSSFTDCPAVFGFDNVGAVCEASNRRAVDFLARSRINFITCSMGGNGTVIPSSIGEQSAVVSVSECVTTLSGKCVLPCELTIKTAPIPNGYPLLAVCSVLLLSGECEHNIEL